MIVGPRDVHNVFVSFDETVVLITVPCENYQYITSPLTLDLEGQIQETLVRERPRRRVQCVGVLPWSVSRVPAREFQTWERVTDGRR